MSSIDNAMLREIVAVEAGISRFRSTSNNWQDYLSILRYLPCSGKNTSAEEFRVRRDAYMDKLLAQLKTDIEDGTDINCITGNILKDAETKLNEGSALSFSVANLKLRSGRFVLQWFPLVSTLSLRPSSKDLRISPPHTASNFKTLPTLLYWRR